jgi:hypothetical protein
VIVSEFAEIFAVNVVTPENVLVPFFKGMLLDNAESGIDPLEIFAPDIVGAFVPNVIVCGADTVNPPETVTTPVNVFDPPMEF